MTWKKPYLLQRGNLLLHNRYKVKDVAIAIEKLSMLTYKCYIVSVLVCPCPSFIVQKCQLTAKAYIVYNYFISAYFVSRLEHYNNI